MVFCTMCGQELKADEVHICANNSGSATKRGGSSLGKDISALASQIDKNLVLELLKNPLVGLRLDPVKDIKYGIIGLAASIIGFIIWAVLISHKIGNIVNGLFGGFSMLMGESSLGSQLIGKLILIGILSIISLMVSVWGIGNWRGNRKINWAEIITRIGSMQLSFGAGFLITGILGLFSLYLSFLAIAIVAFTNLIITVLGGNELYEVEKDHRFLFITLLTSTYLILFYILFRIFN
ncbi:hypothetical protein EHS13_15265 [Paenibacillus psychroresistens]|uniref:Yip1 domain-containing protein n=1 Tax=Paenibacillus psychroresistens TaxID=1778678 RepID=A0A6B8RJX7_9BACL|nr:hypothetical protein [Paenibacillus psychroresistens]QGQ96137.1 hypothetical protein EHS13_15265 [Paenibacillus psychroresistens]